MVLYIHVPFFDGKHGKVLLSLQISPLRLEVLHLVPVVLNKTHICHCSADGEGKEWEGEEWEGVEWDGVGQGGEEWEREYIIFHCIIKIEFLSVFMQCT